MSAKSTESSPKRQTSVEALLENVNEFIQSIYSDVGLLSPPSPIVSPRVRQNRRGISARPSPSPMISSNSSSLNSSSSESELNLNIQSGSNRRLTFSPQNRHNIDAEIERINAICDNVDSNLRSIGVYVTERRGDEAAACANNETFVRPNDFVDLSETQNGTPEVLRRLSGRGQANQSNDCDDDDEVVVVSSNMPPVIDLCTPGRETPFRRSTIERNHLSRRGLDQANQPEEVPLRRRRISSASPKTKPNNKDFTTTPDHKPSHVDNVKDTSLGHDPFICPVCMDSCLRRRPTSTRCGHVYCEQCIKQAIRLTHKCPLCNTKITDKHLIRIYL